MPDIIVPNDAPALGPGYLYWAEIGTALPTDTVEGGVFTDEWPTGWLPFGVTDEGSTFNYEVSTDPVEFAEYLDPTAVVPTGRLISITFALGQIHATNFRRALNGGTLTTTGTGDTTKTVLDPPALGEEERSMVGWESTDNTERLYCFQTFQTGQISVNRRKGSEKATIPVEFTLEQPPTGRPFRYVTAGARRA